MTDNIIEWNKPEPVCSWCKTPKSKVKKLLSNSHDKFVCDACLKKMKEMLKSPG